jgi:hypothetical protein
MLYINYLLLFFSNLLVFSIYFPYFYIIATTSYNTEEELLSHNDAAYEIENTIKLFEK